MEWLIQYFYGGGNPKYSGDDKKKNKPHIFVASENGQWSYYIYCPYLSCGESNEHKYKLKCEKESSADTCWTFAKKRRITWKNSINKRPRTIEKSELKEGPGRVAQIIQELGFYDGDISELKTVDSETGQLDDTKTIIGKTTTTSSDNSSDIVSQLMKLNKLFNDGVLTQEEFNKAKNKLLN